MKISIITLFPEVFDPILRSSILKRAQKKELAEFEFINLRDFGEGKHKLVDDRPYGGGAGMILRADILAKAVQSAVSNSPLAISSEKRTANSQKPYIILTSASGKPYKQAKALKLSELDHLIIVCGHYEGVDQRFTDKYVNEEISIGDYILTGGEIPAMVIVDSITRLIPGVLEKEEATQNESFSIFQSPTSNIQLLEYPHYSRPEQFEGKKVPGVLLSGNHAEIKKWRLQKSLEKTKKPAQIYSTTMQEKIRKDYFPFYRVPDGKINGGLHNDVFSLDDQWVVKRIKPVWQRGDWKQTLAEDLKLLKYYLDPFIPSTTLIECSEDGTTNDLVIVQRRVDGKPLRDLSWTKLFNDGEVVENLIGFGKCVKQMYTETHMTPDLHGGTRNFLRQYDFKYSNNLLFTEQGQV